MKLTMRLQEDSYDIIISRGALSRLGKVTNLMNRKVLVVTDDGVPAEYADTVLAQCSDGVRLVLPQGESSKNLKNLETVLSALLSNEFTRRDAVVAVGGGVIGDLAGFAAACYMRGIAFINCPTTTLSQIDSSIGGKTAVDLNGVKNIVGAFYQPEIVVIDPDALDTLPQRHWMNGMAEAVKAGLIGDERLFELFEKEEELPLEEVLHRALSVKKRFVEQDERESGVRAALNFGHTIGHAIESEQGLGGLYHGECVALGMLPMITDKRLRVRVKKVLERLGLPTKTDFEPSRAMEYLRHDKKAAGNGAVTTVRVDEPGSYRLEKTSFDELETLLREGVWD